MRRIVSLGIALLVAACSGAPAGTSSPAATSVPSTAPPAGSPTGPVTALPTARANAPSAPPTAEPSVAVTAGPSMLRAGIPAATIADRVRVRSMPGIGADSVRFEPVLPRATSLLVLDGPTRADGYDWFHVVPMSSGLRATDGSPFPAGWVAAASRDGDPWVAPAPYDCPPAPTGVEAVLALGSGERLACFGGVPVTFEALLTACDCDVDGPFFEPDWFGSFQLVLVDPSAPTNAVDLDAAIFLALDPAADTAHPLPLDRIVEVTGMFDHAAAASCQVAGPDAPFEPSLDCRFMFAVTSLRPV